MTKSNDGIWWLASYPKSGNTWVRAFLSSLMFGRSDINHLMGVTGDLAPQWYQASTVVPLGDLGPGDEFVLRPAAMANALHLINWRPCILKTHNANLDVDGVPMIPPKLTAGAIYIIRDPRDVAVSMAEHFGVPIEESVDMLCRAEWVISVEHLHHVTSDWSSHVRSWTKDRSYRVGVVRYEDLVDSSVEKLSGIAKYMGIEGDCEHAAGRCRFSALQAQEKISGFKERKNQEAFFARGTYGGWRDLLPAELAAKIEEHHGEVMQKHGYTTTSLGDNQSRQVAACGAA